MECSICLNIMNNCNINLSCGHTFHEKCIRKWLHNNPTCPMCRVKFYDPIVSIFDYTNINVPTDFIKRILRTESISCDKIVLTHQKNNLVIHDYKSGVPIYWEPYPL